MDTAERLNAIYGEGIVTPEVKDQYYNMKCMLEDKMHIISIAEQAITEACGVCHVVPIRGGTDGARLSYEGLPCPNLCTGGENYHGRFEYIPVEDMEKCVQMLVNILTE